MTWAEHAARMEEMENAYKSLIGKPVEKRSLGRSKHRSKDNIIMDPRETGWEVVDWINLAQDRDQCQALVTTVMNLRVP
jgi:hypothetical protein